MRNYRIVRRRHKQMYKISFHFEVDGAGPVISDAPCL
jgi:hypothetical protein